MWLRYENRELAQFGGKNGAAPSHVAQVDFGHAGCPAYRGRRRYFCVDAG
jgi:hypothetical protein